MKIINVPIEEATQAQMLDYARRGLQIEITGNPSKETLIERLSVAKGEPITMIPVLDYHAPPEAVSAAPSGPQTEAELMKDIGKGTRRVWVTVHKGPGDTHYDNYLYLNNGGDTPIYIKRGEPYPMMLKHLENLRNAKRRKPRRDQNLRIVGWDEVPEHPYAFHGLVEDGFDFGPWSEAYMARHADAQAA